MDQECDIIHLAHSLKQEHLFVDAEKKQIKFLNEKIIFTTEKLYHQLWVCNELRRFHDDLVLHPEHSPQSVSQRANQLTQLRFVEGHKILGFYESQYSELLSCVRENPRLLAHCLVAVEHLHPEAMQSAARTLFTSVYGGCLLPEDEMHILTLMKHLMELQIVPADNPRRLLRHGKCAFSRVYRAYVDNLPQAKVFLTAALHQPILQMLMEEDTYLHVDPLEAMRWLGPEERLRRLGREGTAEFDDGWCRYRDGVTSRLAKIVIKFTESLRHALPSFPRPLAWLVRTLHQTLAIGGRPDVARDVCVDLVLSFVCPALVSPEPHGVTDVPVSNVARFNLSQVAQVLQVLAMNQWDCAEVRYEVYSHFEKDAVSSVVDAILDQGICQESHSVLGNTLPGLTRSSCLIPETFLNSLVSFLQTAQSSFTDDEKHLRKELDALLAPLRTRHAGVTPSHVALEPNCASAPPVSTNQKKNLLSRVKSNRLARNKSGNQDGNTDAEISQDRQSLSSHSSQLSSDDVETSSNDSVYDTVLVIPLRINGSVECPGLMAEEKVLASIQANKSSYRVRVNLSSDGSFGGGGTSEEVMMPTEKRTRFSLSHDDGSIGNASDNLEAVSEAASNHSVASSIDDDGEREDQPDNLSDMVSANVSGRGTPNVSGRDTPSSQVTDGEEGGGHVAGVPGGEAQLPPSNVPVTIHKPAGADIEDKFGKFEIEPRMGGSERGGGGGDETISLVSETWSTDVLASDSETVDERNSFRGGLFGGPHMTPLDLDGLLTAERGGRRRCGDVYSETASEAWSMDVLASDSERMTEFDTDDTQSVAPSDGGGGEGEVEGGEMGAAVGGDDVVFDLPDNTAKPISILADPAKVIVKVNSKEDFQAPTGGEVGGFEDNFVTGAGCEALLVNLNDDSSELAQLGRLDLRSELNLSTTSLASSSGSTSEEDVPSMDEPRRGDPVLIGDSSHQTADHRIDSSRTKSHGGAIPKTITFDQTAEKGEREHKHRRNQFFKIRFPSFPSASKGVARRRAGMGGSSKVDDPPIGGAQGGADVPAGETSDDILAKYRNCKQIHVEGITEGAVSVAVQLSSTSDSPKTEDERLFIDPGHLESSYAYLDAKRKLRLVLSMADFTALRSATEGGATQGGNNAGPELTTCLQCQLAEATNLRDRSFVAQLRETLRCITIFDVQTQNQLVRCLHDDYRSRSSYIAYLVNSRLGLLTSFSHLQRLATRMEVDCNILTTTMVTICVRLFMERHESQLADFVSNFAGQSLPDEKVSLVESFLDHMKSMLYRDAMWANSTSEQLQNAQLALETMLMSHIYTNALYPNGDGDISRDQVLHEHMKKLSQVITLDHKDLCIPKLYQYECPWPSAQAEIVCLAAYRTAHDKLKCVVRASQTIMNLLSLAHERTTPAADDFVPVLVYVLIQSNPRSLLSTVQFVNLFYEGRMEGEDSYWWTQFCSAIEFIKTMDYEK